MQPPVGISLWLTPIGLTHFRSSTLYAHDIFCGSSRQSRNNISDKLGAVSVLDLFIGAVDMFAVPCMCGGLGRPGYYTDDASHLSQYTNRVPLVPSSHPAVPCNRSTITCTARSKA